VDLTPGETVMPGIDLPHPLEFRPDREPVRDVLRSILGRDFVDRLTAVDLAECDVSETELAQLGRLPRIEWLGLWESRFDRKGLIHLGKMKQLRWLQVEGTPVLDRDLKHLAGLTKLERLDLSDTQVTDAGIEALAARNLPNLRQ
jgi:hypothetical protein